MLRSISLEQNNCYYGYLQLNIGYGNVQMMVGQKTPSQKHKAPVVMI